MFCDVLVVVAVVCGAPATPTPHHNDLLLPLPLAYSYVTNDTSVRVGCAYVFIYTVHAERSR